MKPAMVDLGTLYAKQRSTIDPRSLPDDEFELYSIPACDRGAPELVRGASVGSAKQLVEPGDVLLSRIVPHIRRAWIVQPDNGRTLIASSEWIVHRNKSVHPAYLRHFLMSDGFHEQFMRTVSGVGGSLLRARPSVAARILVPVPPISEQRRIAAILDMAECINDAHSAVLRKYSRLSQSAFTELFGDPVLNTKSWKSVPLSEATAGKFGVKAGPFGSTLRKEEYTTAGYRVYGQEQVISGRFDIGDYYVGERKFRELSSCAVSQGDVLISLVGTFGRTLIVPGGIEPGIINPRLLKITPNRCLLEPQFLAEFIAHSSVQKELLRLSHGGTMGILNAGLVKNLQIILPPLSDQQGFSEVLRHIEIGMGRQRATAEHLNSLLSNLQYRAFQGEL